MHKPLTVFVDGSSGAVGVTLTELLGDRPYNLIHLNDHRDIDARYNAIAGADIAVLCLPNDIVADTINDNHGTSTVIIDASSFTRLNEDWLYGYFYDIYTGAANVLQSTRISNPGCFATGIQALIHPIQSWLTHYPLVFTGISGYSAGGNATINRQMTNPVAHKMTNITRQHTHVGEVRFRSGLTNDVIFLPAVGSFAEGQVVSIPLARHQLTIPIEEVYEQVAAYYYGCDDVVVWDEAPKSISPEIIPRIDASRISICVAEFDNHAVLHAWYSNLNFGAAGSVVRIIDKIAEGRITNGTHTA